MNDVYPVNIQQLSGVFIKHQAGWLTDWFWVWLNSDCDSDLDTVSDTSHTLQTSSARGKTNLYTNRLSGQ